MHLKCYWHLAVILNVSTCILNATDLSACLKSFVESQINVNRTSSYNVLSKTISCSTIHATLKCTANSVVSCRLLNVGTLDSIPGQFMLILSWIKWKLVSVFSDNVGISCQVSFRHSTLAYLEPAASKIVFSPSVAWTYSKPPHPTTVSLIIYMHIRCIDGLKIIFPRSTA